MCRGAEGVGADRTINLVPNPVVIIACQPCLTPCHPPSKASEKTDSPISAPSRETVILLSLLGAGRTPLRGKWETYDALALDTGHQKCKASTVTVPGTKYTFTHILCISSLGSHTHPCAWKGQRHSSCHCSEQKKADRRHPDSFLQWILNKKPDIGIVLLTGL